MSKSSESLMKEANDLRVINQFRKSQGLSLIKPKNRLCLKCERYFYSENITNRLCLNCKGAKT